MPNKRIEVSRIQEIQRLKALGHSKRKVSKLLGIDRGAVGRYWDIEQSSLGVIAPQWTTEINWECLKKELHSGVPRKILYSELKQFICMPSYQAFCQYLRNHEDKPCPTITIRIVRNPGDSVEVDYSGDGHYIVNPATGECINVELFVGALSYSGYFFAEFTHSQRLEDFISSHNHMFAYLGGVPRYIIPDNCKTAVSKADKYDPVTNRTYQDMCEYYGIVIDPADSQSPRQKPNVERAVKMIQTSFLPSIRHNKFTSLMALNKELRKWTSDMNNNEIIRTRGQTRLFFYCKEQPVFSSLPSTPYELFYFSKRKVHPDCHIQHNKNYYSVPYRFVGCEVDIRFNNRMIYIYYSCELIATHAVCKGTHNHSTNVKHYPEKKYVESDYHLTKARKDAVVLGENVGLLLNKLSKEARYPLKILRKVQGIVGLSKTFSRDALNYACGMALEFERTNYNEIKRFAKNYKKEKDNTGAPRRQLELAFLQGEDDEGNNRFN